MALLLSSLVGKLTPASVFTESLMRCGPCITTVKFTKLKQILPPKSGKFKRQVHYPEEYTVQPLQVTRLGGRDPVSGRKVVNRVGGGLKYKYHWLELNRFGPKDDVPPQEEKVILIKDAFERTAKVALVATGETMKWIIATENMKPGDILRTSQYIPYNPVLANEGDAYPLGAFPLNSMVCNVEKYAGRGAWYCKAAGTTARITKHIGDKVVIVIPSKEEIALPKTNMAVLGRVSNPDHGKTPIGSAQRARELGIKPKSGLWHRKDGRYGRKIHPPKPLKFIGETQVKEHEKLQLTMYMKLKAQRSVIQ